MNARVLERIDSLGEPDSRSQLISLLVSDPSKLAFNEQVEATVEDETCPNGRREISLYLGSHCCQRQSDCDCDIELWAVSDSGESDFAMWRLYVDGSHIFLPLSYCPLCGLHLYGMVIDRD